MRWLLGVCIALLLAAGVTVAVVQPLEVAGGDDGERPRPNVGNESVVLPPGQALVTGTVTRLTGDGLVGAPPAPTPLTITAPSRGLGNGATVEGALVDGQRSSIVWDAGRPFALEGQGGALIFGPAQLELDPATLVVGLDGGPHRFAPAAYRLDSPVAVGGGGLASSVEGVSFEADDRTTVTFAGTASLALPPGALTLTGPGRLTADGSFEVRTAEGARQATHLEFGAGSLEVTLTPVAGGFAVEATLQGPLQAA